MRLSLYLFLLFFIFCSPLFSQKQNIKTAVLVINSINVFEKSQLGNDILVSFQEAALALKKEADLNVKKFEDEELELTKKREILTKKEFNQVAEDFDKRVQKTRNLYDLKDSQLRGNLESWKKKFIELSGRVIQPIMANYNAYIVLDSSQIDLFFDNRIDITELVILELDSLYKSDPKYLEIIIGK
ncbi:OmpH family outer membrane protein [Paracoccaceae bacterium]|nr:OmpH family outer membrane protein [Paracoccaceae bacterium]